MTYHSTNANLQLRPAPGLVYGRPVVTDPNAARHVNIGDVRTTEHRYPAFEATNVVNSRFEVPLAPQLRTHSLPGSPPQPEQPLRQESSDSEEDDESHETKPVVGSPFYLTPSPPSSPDSSHFNEEVIAVILQKFPGNQWNLRANEPPPLPDNVLDTIAFPLDRLTECTIRFVISPHDPESERWDAEVEGGGGALISVRQVLEAIRHSLHNPQTIEALFLAKDDPLYKHACANRDARIGGGNAGPLLPIDLLPRGAFKFAGLRRVEEDKEVVFRAILG